MATLHLMVGLPSSGKTLLARQAEEQLRGWIYFFQARTSDESERREP